MFRRIRCLALVGLSAAILILATPTVARANGAKLVFGGTPAYLWTELDFLQNGNVPSTSNQVMSTLEFHEVFGTTPDESGIGTSNDFIFSLCPSYSWFSHPYNPLADIEGQPVPVNLVYLHDAIVPILQIGDAFGLGDWLHVRAVMDLTPSIRFMEGTGSYGTWDVGTLVMEFPRESYISAAVPHAGLALGRFKSGIGHGYFGNTFLNGRAPFYDQIQATYHTGTFRFSYMLGSSQSFLTESEAAAQAYHWDDLNNHDGSVFDNPVKICAYHRVEFHPAHWVTLGVGEMNLVGGKFPDFDHINPVGIWHNTYTPGCSNVMASIDAAIVPFKGLLIYGEFTLDDFRLPTEDPESKPNCFAYQAGLRYVLPFSDETKHAIGAEFTHVDPWTYNRWQPYLTMYQRIMKTGPMYLDIPLGYPYGGDLNHYGIYCMMVNRSGFTVQAAYHRLDKGAVEFGLDKNGIPIFEDYDSDPGPTGVVEHRDTLELSATYPFSPDLSLSVRGNYCRLSNYGHVEGMTG